MSEAKETPLEIWIVSKGHPESEDATWSSAKFHDDDIRYVRADLYEQMQRRANEFELKAARLEYWQEEVINLHPDLEEPAADSGQLTADH